MAVNSTGLRSWSPSSFEEVASGIARGITEHGVVPRSLTVEVALYGLITFAALIVRLAALGRWPLLENEAHTALAAWRALQGAPPVRAFDYVPLLYDANLLLFALSQASDAAVRLLPAFMGAALVLLPYFCRDVLGRQGSLLASLLLAFAPTWVFFSRTAEGAILIATLSGVILLSVSRYLQEGHAGRLQLAFVALGLGLTAGPGMYTFLLYAFLYGGVWWLTQRDDVPRNRLRRLLEGAFTRRNVLSLVGTFLLFGSAFLTNPGGIGASVNLGGQWVRALSSEADLSSLALVKTLLTYEFLTMALALVGLVWGLRQKDTVTLFLALWIFWGLLLSIPLGHREPRWLPNLLLPLVILAARGFQYLWDHVLAGAGWDEGIAFWVMVALTAFGFLELFAFTHTAQERYLFYAAGGCLMLLAMWVACWFWLGRRGALAVGAGLLLLSMGIMTIRASTAVAYQTGRDAREGLVYRPASMQLRLLERFLLDLSSRRTGGLHALDIDYEEALDPWMSWYLRDYPNARSVPLADSQTATSALITSERSEKQWPAGYAGQRFYLWEHHPAQDLSGRQWLRWFFYRDAVGTIEARQVQVWIRLGGDGEQ
ncbi:MAG: glycosyltransferase family 39 protein [Chloroflexota bacterium]|nr:glycosyltransferase family 39 protein [Chloroflexota bacterium]